MDNESDSDVNEEDSWGRFKATKRQDQLQMLEDMFDRCISHLNSMKEELDDPCAFQTRRQRFEEALASALNEYEFWLNK